MGNKKVGLIGYHFLYNYGTMLQAYALQRKIQDLGFQVEYIDYRFKEVMPSYKKRLWIRIKRLGVYLFYFKYYWNKIYFRSKVNIQKRFFDTFYSKYINKSSIKYLTISDLESNPSEYDIYIVGGDQVWNPNLSCSTPAYYLSFVKDDKKKAAYASSLGVTTLSLSQRQNIAQYLKNFSFLSCREVSGAKLLESICNRKVLHVLDPTFLLEQKVWNEIAITPKIPKPYILCYFLGDKKYPRQFVRNLETKTGIKAYYIPCSPLDMSNKNAIYEVGPSEFLGLIKEASYVCTDSYHGTIFSIIFEKQFFVFLKRSDEEPASDNIRIKELLSYVGLEIRLIDSNRKIPDLEDKIDYNVVKTRLQPLKERSEAYLLEILNSIRNG